MITDMGKFFSAISSRMWKENDLSDMTFALCEGNLKFKQFMLDFFFGVGTIDASKAKIIRELSMDGSRPDFWITTGETNYIIEVKIWDKSHHFQQYLPFVDNKKERLGYIAAYHITSDSDGSVIRKDEYPGLKTWKELIVSLGSEVKEEGIGVGDPAIVGYMKYVRNVCGIGEDYPEINKIKGEVFKNLNQICSSYIYAVKNCKCNGCDFYYKSPTSSDFTSRKGVFFVFDYKGKPAYGFIGIYFGTAKESPFFVVEFENTPGWSACICQDLKILNQHLRFYPDENIINNGKELSKFLEYVINAVCEGDITKLNTHKPSYESLKNLKSIQLLDRMLRNGFLNFERKLNDKSYLVRYYQNNRSWWGAVGEYFEIILPNGDVTWGWTGVTYADDKILAVLRFRSDWNGPFKNLNEIVLWEWKQHLDDELEMNLYLDRLKESLNSLISNNINNLVTES